MPTIAGELLAADYSVDASRFGYTDGIPLDNQHDKIIEHLDLLNKQVARQNSVSRMFIVGIVYGVGFFFGSAIIATIAFGVLGPWFAQIPWVRTAFETGHILSR